MLKVAEERFIDGVVVADTHKTNDDLVDRIERYATTTLDVNQHLWEAQVTTGRLGASNAIPLYRIPSLERQHCTEESLALFRVHHALCDGVSLSVAVGDLCDEASELREEVASKLKKHNERERARLLGRRIADMMSVFLFFTLGTVIALSRWWWQCLMSVNPFDKIMAASGDYSGARSTTWRFVARVEQVKHVGRLTAKSITVNDVVVGCVSAAIRRQLQFHHRILNNINTDIPSHVNVVIPSHLTGGVLLPGQSLGNKIGAYAVAVPAGHSMQDPSDRLKEVSKSIQKGKSTPAALLSWTLAKVVSDYFPLRFAKWILRHGNGHSVAVISNVKGMPFKTHLAGRPVEAIIAFLPLPPGIPIGVLVQSYDGNLFFSVTADRRAVPDVDMFAEWVLEEYQQLKEVTNRCEDGEEGKISIPSLVVMPTES